MFPLLVTLVLLAWLPACRSSTDVPRQRLVFRLIDEEPRETFVNRGLHAEVPIVNWTFTSDDSMAGWELTNTDHRSGLEAAGLRVSCDRDDRAPRPYMARAVDLEANSIQDIRIKLSRPNEELSVRGHVRLFWCRAGEVFSDERSLSLEARTTDDLQTESYTFRVGTHPLWSGKIAMLRLDPTSAPGETVTVQAVEAVRYIPASETYVDALRNTWKVKIRDELRNAILAPPGRPFERHFRTPPDSVLRFSYGIGSLIPVPITFKVFLGSKAGRKLLFEDMIRPRSPKSRRGWLDASVDLSEFDGEQITLSFQTFSQHEYDTRVGFPAWANPEIWQRASESVLPNVILISLDTLRADRMSLYGYEHETTPNIDRWARRAGVVFENVVAPSPWTIPSHVSLFTGLNALRHGVNHSDAPLSPYTYMAEWFREAGYSTIAVTGGGYLHPAYGFHRGFDSFRYWAKETHSDGELEDGIDRLIRLLHVNHNRQFFVFFHTYEIHFPFRERQPFFGDVGEPISKLRATPKEVTPREENGFLIERRYVKSAPPGSHSTPLQTSDYPVLNRMYDSGIAFTDFHLGRLFQELEDLGLWGQTIVVVTSDHGEALGERGLAGHGYLYDFNLMIPLVFFLPEGKASRIPEQVSLVDVLPTLLELDGTRPTPDLDGRSLAPLIQGQSIDRPREAWSYAAHTNHGISLRIDNEMKYIYNNTAWSPIHGREELYRVDQDRKEEENISTAEPILQRLREHVRQNLRIHSSGLSIRFTNEGKASFEGELQGPFLHFVRIKSHHMPCDCVKWTGSNRFEFVVPPDQSFELVLEGIKPGSMTLDVAMKPTGPLFQAQFDPAKLIRPRHWLFADRAWTEVDGEAPPSMMSVITVTPMGDLSVSGERPAIDSSLLEQLRALGYLK